MEIGNIIAFAATGVGLGEIQHLCAYALFEYDCKTCFFSSIVWQNYRRCSKNLTWIFDDI